MSTLSLNAPLPKLRKELQILPGIREVNGTRSWLIFDPVRHVYFQISDQYRKILSQWESATPDDIIKYKLPSQTNIDEIEALLRFLWENCLTEQPPANDHQYYLSKSKESQNSWVNKLLHGYLFLIIPLIRPAKLLFRFEPLTRWLFTRSFIATIALLGVISLFLVSRQWDQFIHTFMHFFSFEGAAYYVIALAIVKIAHECGHAFSATRYGCTVKSMGVALIVMFPVLYTDTSDTWKLTSKKQRLVVDAAGVAVELSIAVFATLIWCFSTDGPMRSAAFFLATTSWAMSLLINMNPLMRFDAYYFLSDLTGVQNLQNRSFSLGRWRMREYLFKLNHAQPESLPTVWSRSLAFYAWATWIYRFFLFLGIAILVHKLFPRPFGTILAAIELYFFIVNPIMREMRQWHSSRAEIFSSLRTWITISVLCSLAATLIIPWHTQIKIPAVIEPSSMVVQHSPTSASVSKVHIAQNSQVQQGDLLIELKSPWLEKQMEIVNAQIQLRKTLLARTAADHLELSNRLIVQQELARYEEERIGIQNLLEQLHIKAPYSGHILDITPDIHEGRWVKAGQPLLKINGQSGSIARGFIEQHQLDRVSQNAEAEFRPDLPELKTSRGTVSIVETANTDTINLSALTSTYGGPIAVNQTEGKSVPLKTWHQLSATMDDRLVNIDQQRIGTLVINGHPESLLRRFSERVAHVLLREFHI